MLGEAQLARQNQIRANLHFSRRESSMRAKGFVAIAALLIFTAAAPALAQGEKQGQGTAIVTILPKHDGDAAPGVSAASVTLKVNGHDAKVGNVVALGADSRVELVFLIDSGSRSSLGSQLEEMESFLKSLPPNTKATVGYMQNGHATLAGPLSADHAAVSRGLHLPGGSPGSNGSPYFCLSDLAKNWPSRDTAARRIVLMVTDGVDEFERRFDPDDPYVQAAKSDAVKAGLVVYSIYWRGQGQAGNSAYESNAGQSLLTDVSETTGGKNFWQGTGNPVSFQPFLEELSRRLKNQYELSFLTNFNGKPQVEPMKLKFSAPGVEVNAPHQVFVTRQAPEQN
jgi:hypothetical protein